MKIHLISKITKITCISVFSATIASAKTIGAEIKLPNANRIVNAQIDVSKSEYKLPVSELVIGEYFVTKTDQSCSDMEGFVDTLKGQTPAKYFKINPYTVEFRVLDGLGGSDEVEEQIAEVLDSNGSSVKSPKNVTSFIVENISAQFEWDDNALSNEAGLSIVDAAQKELIQSLNNDGAKFELAKTGTIKASLQQGPLYCDLLNKNVRITVGVSGNEVSKSVTPSLISAKSIKSISESSARNLKAVDKTKLREEEVARIASGVLALELQKRDLFYSIVNRGDFIPLLNAITYKNSELKEVSYSEAIGIQKSLTKVNTDLSEFSTSDVTLRKVRK